MGRTSAATDTAGTDAEPAAGVTETIVATLLSLLGFFVKPRPAGCLWLYPVFLGSGALTAWRKAAEPASMGSSVESTSSVTVVIVVLTVILAAALVVVLVLRRPRPCFNLVYAFVGLGWHGIAGLALATTVTSIVDTVRGADPTFGLRTMCLITVSLLVVAPVLNHCVFLLQTSAAPASEAVTFVVATQLLLAVAAVVTAIGLLEGYFGFLVNEVMLAAATGLTVLGIPTSVAVWVTLRRHEHSVELVQPPPASEESEAPRSPSSALSPLSAVLVGAGVTALLLAGRGPRRAR